MNYPIKYAVEELKVTGDISIDYEDVTKGFIVSKCYVLEKRINYGSGNEKYVVSFPYDNFETFMKWFKIYEKNYNSYIDILYKRYHEERREPASEYIRDGYPKHIVDNLYDTYEEAKEVADHKNSYLKGEKLINTGNTAYQKLSQEFAYIMQLCSEYEKFVFDNTDDMKITKNGLSNNNANLLPEEIKHMANNLTQLYEIKYQEIKPFVEYIINNNITNIVYIEQILEQLLNTPYEPCYELFVKLCNYVAKFNNAFAQEYLAIWDDIYGEETSKTRKKEKD